MEITDKDRLDFIVNHCYTVELIASDSGFCFFRNDFPNDKEILIKEIDKAIMDMLRESGHTIGETINASIKSMQNKDK